MAGGGKGFIISSGYFHRHNWTDPWEYPSLDEAIVSLERNLPSLYPSHFEREFPPSLDILIWTRNHYWLAFYVTLAYLVFVWIGPRVMAKRKAFDLRSPLKYWNLFLAIYSFLGMIRVVPHVIGVIYKMGFLASLCSPPVYVYGNGASGFWTFLFIYSKYAELVDTVFIVLRKKHLSFLHWYHHATVLLYTWDAFVQEQPPGLYYCAMNYTVHAVMYFYYFLASVMAKPPKWGIFVTVLQITQMFFGVIITGITLWFSFRLPYPYRWTQEMAMNPFSVPGCYVSRMNLLGACLMYSTYFYLFAEFFIGRYFKKRVSARKEDSTINLAGETGGAALVEKESKERGASPLNGGVAGGRSGHTGSSVSTPVNMRRRKPQS